jgi:hypothetical protein
MKHRDSGVPIDISLAVLPFEQEAIAHRRMIDVGGLHMAIPRVADLLVTRWWLPGRRTSVTWKSCYCGTSIRSTCLAAGSSWGNSPPFSNVSKGAPKRAPFGVTSRGRQSHAGPLWTIRASGRRWRARASLRFLPTLPGAGLEVPPYPLPGIVLRLFRDPHVVSERELQQRGQHHEAPRAGIASARLPTQEGVVIQLLLDKLSPAFAQKGVPGQKGRRRLPAPIETELQARRSLVRRNGKVAEVNIVGHIALRHFEGRPCRSAAEQPLVEHGLEGRAGPGFERRSRVDGRDGGIPPVGMHLGPRQHGARIAGVENSELCDLNPHPSFRWGRLSPLLPGRGNKLVLVAY